MWRYYHLLLNKTNDEITAMKQGIDKGTHHPMVLKKDMAAAIIARFWSTKEAEIARQNFESLFQKKDYSKANEVELPAETKNPLWIVELLKQLKAITSTSEAKRLIESNAVEIDEKAVADFKAEIIWKSGTTIKVGKHKFYKIK